MKYYAGPHIKNPDNKSIIQLLKDSKNIGGNIIQIYVGSNHLTTLKSKADLNKEEIKNIKKFLKERYENYYTWNIKLKFL